MKKKELTFIIGIVAFAVVLWGGMYLARRGHYGTIRITVNGEEYGTYSLAKDQVIKINDTNVCEIKNGEVKMTEADCPDHLCMKQKAVDNTGGTIVCLPNKVVIEGEKGNSSAEESPEFDTAV
nr:NusG domain II-containing protein [uncultured Blautia sp.]